MDNYILDEENNPVLEPDFTKWAKWREKNNNRIALTELCNNEVRVSTVFLGTDHSFGVTNKPILWETMIFGGIHDEYQERYSSYVEALEGHTKAVKLVITGE